MYNSLNEKSNKYNERNDCSVRAVASILNTSYEDSHNMHRRFGRKDGSGTCWTVTRGLLEDRGFKLRSIAVPRYIKTVRHLENSGIINEGMFLIQTSKHIAGCVDGEVLDHIAGGRYRPTHLHEVIPTENAVYSEDATMTPVKARKKRPYKYALIHKETKEEFHKFKILRDSTRRAVEHGTIYIKGRKKETQGNLIIVKL